jgi:hypothetical protein
MEALSAKVATVSGRDKYLGVIQFFPMLAEAPLEGLGFKALGSSLAVLSGIAGSARTLTRFSLSADAVFTTPRMDGIAKMPSGPWKAVAALQFFFDACFCPFEHTSFLAGAGVIANPDDRAGRYGGGAVTCWMWGIILNIIVTIRDITAARARAKIARSRSESASRENAQVRGFGLKVVKLLCYLVVALSFLPKTGVRLLGANPSGPLLPLHKIFSVIAPPPLEISNTVRGVFGTTAALLEFA